MSGPVDVLAVLDEFALYVRNVSSRHALQGDILETRAAVAELIEAAAARLKEGSGQMTEAEHRLSNAIALVIGNRLPGNAGWVLVPPEPTEVMLNAALKLQGDDAFLARAPAVLSAFVKIYKAMIANTGGAK